MRSFDRIAAPSRPGSLVGHADLRGRQHVVGEPGMRPAAQRRPLHDHQRGATRLVARGGDQAVEHVAQRCRVVERSDRAEQPFGSRQAGLALAHQPFAARASRPPPSADRRRRSALPRPPTTRATWSRPGPRGVRPGRRARDRQRTTTAARRSAAELAFERGANVIRNARGQRLEPVVRSVHLNCLSAVRVRNFRQSRRIIEATISAKSRRRSSRKCRRINHLTAVGPRATMECCRRVEYSLVELP